MQRLVVLVLLPAVLATQMLQFASYYGDHMVLQRAPQTANIWGFAALDTVSVTMVISNTSNWSWKGTANVLNSPPTWKLTLPPLQGGPYTIAATDGVTTVAIIDVLFGDVWICSGQSNMQFTVVQAFNATAEVVAADDYPQLRLFTAALIESDNASVPDLLGINQYWSVASSASINSTVAWDYFSATCWFFGRDLANSLGKDVPIGLLTTCWGGTNVEAWSSPDALKTCGWINPPEPAMKKQISKSPEDFSTVSNPDTSPSSLWNAMIYPLLNMTIKGAVWYQGEANVGNPTNYSCEFPAMIADWRVKWAAQSNTSPTFPFGFVQLAGYCACGEPANECNNALSNISIVAPVRWAQTASLGVVPNTKMPNVFMASAVDLSDASSPECDIHPRSKQEVGRRLSLGALNLAYGQSSLPYQGPYPTSAKLSANSPRTGYTNWNVTMTFTSVGSGLYVNTSNIPTVVAFELFWNNDDIVIANLVSANATVIVTTVQAPNTLGTPAAIRHLWRDRPCINEDQFGGNCLVYNSYGLPLPPFYIPFA